ncbi:hypothetical protein GGR53DRAFT_462374 [Hypoxylon sp. FL1150]|nr:hypothetical protein GGR53DRAFT_462374 [Hypoxylon sp. FL1150]
MNDIRKYFTQPPRFQFVKLVGKGEYAQAFQVKFNDARYPHIKHFVVKKALNNNEAKEALQEEKNHLIWPDSYEKIPPGVDARGLSHNDIHYENVLLGVAVPDSEHGITPILKVIDFGMAKYGREKEKRNVEDIGEIMMYLIDLSTELLDPDTPEEDLPEIVWEGKKIQTDATRIVPFKKGVDPLLQSVVCACLINSDVVAPPTLKYLLATAENAVNYPPASYRNRPEEQDDAISKLWEDIVHNA